MTNPTISPVIAAFAVLGAAFGLPGPARASDVALVALGPPQLAQSAERGLVEAAEDTGRDPLRPRQVTRRAGGGFEAKVEACAGKGPCLTKLAEAVGAPLWLATVANEAYGVRVTVQIVEPGGARAPAGLPGLKPAEVEAAAYGSAFRFAGGSGKGKLEVTSEPAGAEVRVTGTVLGVTPLVVELDGGAMRLEAAADGFLSWNRLVRVRPGKTSKLAIELEPDAGDIPLAGLGLGLGLGPDTAVSAPPTDPEPAVPPDPKPDPEVAVAEAPPADPAPDDTGALSLPPLTTSEDPAGTEVAVADLSPESVAGRPDAVPPKAVTLEAPGAGLSIGGPTYAVLGGGLVGLGTALGFGMQASGRARSARSAEIQLDVQAFNDQARKSAVAANVLYVVGALALGAGGYLLYDDVTAGP